MPENTTEPSAILPARSRMRITAYDVTDLPEPDSPTMPSVSPFPTLMLTCCTAFTMPRRVVNSTVRSLTSSRGWAVMTTSAKISKTTPCKVERSAPLPHSLCGGRNKQSLNQPSRPPLRIDDVAQAVAEQVEAEHRDHQREPREQRDPPFARHHEAGALRDHDAPLRGRRSHAEANERQAGGVEDGVAHGQRHLHDHDRHDIGQDMHKQYPELAIAGQARRLHEAGIAADIGFGAGDAGIEWKIHDRGRDDDVLHGIA